MIIKRLQLLLAAVLLSLNDIKNDLSKNVISVKS